MNETKYTNEVPTYASDSNYLSKFVTNSDDVSVNNDTISSLNLLEFALGLQNEQLTQLQEESASLIEKYNNLCEVLPLGAFITDETGIIHEMNHRCADILGVNKNSVIKKNFTRYISAESLLTFYNLREIALNTNTLQASMIKLISRRGPVFDANLHTMNISSRCGENSRLLFFIFDDQPTDGEHGSYTTHSDHNIHQINTFTELLSTIASEINQPLCIISNYLYGCLHRLESNNIDSNELIKVMTVMSKQSQRAADMIVRMKNFNCKNKLTIEPVCINSILNDVVKSLKYETLDYPVEIICRTISDSVQIEADKVHIEQIILNLSRNAIDSMRDSNTPNAKLIIEANRIGLKSIEISICDNGPGISSDIMPRLFDCHYTTKPYGTGMGLAIIRTIIEAHHGKLYIESSGAAGGACFRFTLCSVEE